MLRRGEKIRKSSKRPYTYKALLVHIFSTVLRPLWLRLYAKGVPPIRLRKTTSHQGYLAVVAIFRDEAPYLKEWLDFHIKAGVDHFFLFNHLSDDNFREILADYPAKVTLRDWAGRQPVAYQRAVVDHGLGYRWMMFIDVDEFVFPSKGVSLPEVLRHMESEDLILLPWRVFGTGGIDDRDRTTSVVSTFRHSIDYSTPNLPSRASTVKAIANPRAMRRAETHCPEMRRGTRPAVWSNGEPFSNKNNAYSADQQIFLHHYVSKSRAEFEEKKSRNVQGNLFPSSYKKESNDKIVALADSREAGVENTSAIQFLDRHSRKKHTKGANRSRD